MAVYRQFQISFWQDEFVDELTPEERYFYIYLLTNSKTRQCGIYKFNKKLAALETGFTVDMVNNLLKRFADYGKVLISNVSTEVFILNWRLYSQGLYYFSRKTFHGKKCFGS
jgi:hypothetical protein